MLQLRFALILFASFYCSLGKAQSLRPVALTCEYQEAPIGIDTEKPRFSWKINADGRNQYQQAYELEVSQTPFAQKTDWVWQSGKVLTGQQLHINYAGSPLQSFKKYYWRVKLYNKDGQASEWSKPAFFETAMLSSADWKAKWIGDNKTAPTDERDFYKEDPMPVFRKTFTAGKKISTARLYVTGIGYYEAYLNGKKVGDHELDPGWTRYDKEILYSVFDVTNMLKQGKNVAGLMLGNGWYNAWPMRMWGRFNLREALATGRPAAIAQLRVQYTDGSVDVIVTDDSWQMKEGPVLQNSVYRGEAYDARKYPSNWWSTQELLLDWQQAKTVATPRGILRAQNLPPIRTTKIVKPVAVVEPSPGTYVFDMGQNFAGLVKINVKGPAGSKVVLRYGEDKYKDGNVNLMTSVTGQIKNSNGGPGAPAIAWQEDSYILSGKGTEIWQPRFTFHGFRYVEVKGWPGKPSLSDLEGLRMNSDVQQNGQFTSSNSMFNKVDDITDWTFLSNIFSVQSDCPAREKFGYGGDIFATAEAYSYRYNMAQFYAKSIRDFANDQRPQGGITETAPYVGIADKSPGDDAGPLGWQLAYPYMLQQMYDFYGDTRILEEQYDVLVKQVSFLSSTAKGHLHFQDISDHESLDTKPEALSASVFYLHHVQLLTRFAKILDKAADAQKYEQLAAQIKATIEGQFIVPGTGRVDNATQAAQIFALYYNLASEKEKKLVLKQLLSEVERQKGHLSTGIFATKMMFDVFRLLNKNEEAYKIANQSGFPGWAYMLDNGATTLWETWAYSDNIYSQNHPMFGSIGEWFYRSLLGINSAGPGFAEIIIKPQPAGDLKTASGSYESVRGTISSAWKREKGFFELKVQIPTNTRAEIWVPSLDSKTVKESDKPISDTSDIRFKEMKDGYAVYIVGSGSYRFTVN